MAAGSDWTTLDREVEALSSSLAPQGGGVAIGGYLDLGYTNNGDSDTSRFGGNNLRLGFSAENSGYGITVNTQAFNVLDAYVTTAVGGMNGTAGLFKAPMGASGGRAERNQFFQDRSAIGSNFAGRSSGIMVGGDSGAFNWAVAIQNASDPVGDLDPEVDDYQITLHADFTVMGSGSSTEGCYGAADGMGLVIGASMTDDDDSADSSTVIDASLTSSTFSASVEFADMGGSTTGAGGSIGATSAATGDSPMAIAVTYAVGTDWEIGIRHQDLDTAGGDTDLDIAANYYVSGHDVKYTLGYSMSDDDADNGTDTITIGFQIGF